MDLVLIQSATRGTDGVSVTLAIRQCAADVRQQTACRAPVVVAHTHGVIKVSISIPRRRVRRTPSRVAIAAVVTLLGSMLAVLGASGPAQSETTVSPVEPGNVVRDGSVNLDVDVSAKSYWRSSATGAFATSNSITNFLLGRVCLGDNTAGTNNSPRTTLTVLDPNGDTVLTQQSPVRNLSDLFAAPTFEPTSPPPAPANGNYRGDFDSANAYHGLHTSLDLTGKPAGVYTVTTTHQNMVKTGTGACAVGTPTGSPANTFVPGPVVETDTFEYRPWAHRFDDALGKGSVRANITPREFVFSIGSKQSPIYQGTPQSQSFYALDGAFLLPSDPEACVADLTACLPSSALACEPSDRVRSAPDGHQQAVSGDAERACRSLRPRDQGVHRGRGGRRHLPGALLSGHDQRRAVPLAARAAGGAARRPGSRPDGDPRHRGPGGQRHRPAVPEPAQRSADRPVERQQGHPDLPAWDRPGRCDPGHLQLLAPRRRRLRGQRSSVRRRTDALHAQRGQRVHGQQDRPAARGAERRAAGRDRGRTGLQHPRQVHQRRAARSPTSPPR